MPLSQGAKVAKLFFIIAQGAKVAELFFDSIFECAWDAALNSYCLRCHIPWQELFYASGNYDTNTFIVILGKLNE